MTEPICLLFVDDEDNVLQSIKRMLFNADYTIHTANSGAEGLKVLESGAPVQVVVSDYRMPEGRTAEEGMKRECSVPGRIRP